MNKDKLFLLKPDFRKEGAGPFYCPESAMVEGVLSFYPQLRKQLDVVYVDFPRPRTAVIAEIGEAQQGCPVLVLAPGSRVSEAGIAVQESNGRRFIADEAHIRRYLGTAHGIGQAV